MSLRVDVDGGSWGISPMYELLIEKVKQRGIEEQRCRGYLEVGIPIGNADRQKLGALAPQLGVTVPWQS